MSSIGTSKNQNPREGIETRDRHFFGWKRTVVVPSKNQNPREGIETEQFLSSSVRADVTSKNQNPREGIETYNTTTLDLHRPLLLQKTKIPARGLKRVSARNLTPRCVPSSLQKTKIPARGLKHHRVITHRSPIWDGLQKTKIPARGLKRTSSPQPFRIISVLQKTKIPARGLKPMPH